MSLDSQLDMLVTAYQDDPRNKVFVNEAVLLASVAEECGTSITSEQLRQIVTDYQDGDLDDDATEIYDGAVYACAEIARRCFADDPDDESEEVDYQISWIEAEDGSVVAEVRPD